MRIGMEAMDGSGGSDRKQPPEDVYDGVIGAIEDVGIQKGFGDKPPRRVVIIGVELVQTASGEPYRSDKGEREVLFKKYNLNLWKKQDGTKQSDFRAFLDGLRPNAVAEAHAAGLEVDTDGWVGLPVRVTVDHDAKGRAKVNGFMRSKAAPGTFKAERDYSQPFGLWDYLLKHQEG